jgi:hypothetical protein
MLAPSKQVFNEYKRLVVKMNDDVANTLSVKINYESL